MHIFVEDLEKNVGSWGVTLKNDRHNTLRNQSPHCGGNHATFYLSKRTLAYSKQCGGKVNLETWHQEWDISPQEFWHHCDAKQHELGERLHCTSARQLRTRSSSNKGRSTLVLVETNNASKEVTTRIVQVSIRIVQK